VDPVTLVVTALATGASAGLSETVAQAIVDAYAGLKSLLRRRLVARQDDPEVVAADDTEPEAWRERLAGRLDAADVDDELLAAAERVLAVADPAGYRAGWYVVDLRGAKGVQVGDDNVQNNTFN
jgi:hypothetical protein